MRREQLVAEIRDRLTRFGAPRLQLLLSVVLAGTAAFQASVAGLRLGVTSMAVRYPIARLAAILVLFAAIGGYAFDQAAPGARLDWRRRARPRIGALMHGTVRSSRRSPLPH